LQTVTTETTTTTMITLMTIPETDNPIEARPSFLVCLGSDTAELLATTVHTGYQISVLFILTECNERCKTSK